MDDLRATRIAKADALRARGVNPFAYGFRVTHHTADAVQHFDTLSAAGTTVSIAGRLTGRRTHGKAGFADVADWSGKIQLYVKKDLVGDETFDIFLNLLDLGDVVGVT